MTAGKGRPAEDVTRVETHDLELRSAQLGPNGGKADEAAAPRVGAEDQTVIDVWLRMKGDAVAKGVKVVVTDAKADQPSTPSAPTPPASPPPAAASPARPGPWSHAFAMAIGSLLGAILLGKLKGEPWADAVIDWVLARVFSACKLIGDLALALLP